MASATLERMQASRGGRDAREHSEGPDFSPCCWHCLEATDDSSRHRSCRRRTGYVTGVGWAGTRAPLSERYHAITVMRITGARPWRCSKSIPQWAHPSPRRRGARRGCRSRAGRVSRVAGEAGPSRCCRTRRCRHPCVRRPVRAGSAPFLRRAGWGSSACRRAGRRSSDAGGDHLVEAELAAELRHVEVDARGHQHQVVPGIAMPADRCQRVGEAATRDRVGDERARQRACSSARGVPRSVARSRDCLSAARSRSNAKRTAAGTTPNNRSNRQRAARELAQHERKQGVAMGDRAVEIEDGDGHGARCYTNGALPRFATIAAARLPLCVPTLPAPQPRPGRTTMSERSQVHSAAARQGAGDRRPDRAAAGAASARWRAWSANASACARRPRSAWPNPGAARRPPPACCWRFRWKPRAWSSNRRRGTRNPAHRDRPQRALRAARHARRSSAERRARATAPSGCTHAGLHRAACRSAANS